MLRYQHVTVGAVRVRKWTFGNGTSNWRRSELPSTETLFRLDRSVETTAGSMDAGST